MFLIGTVGNLRMQTSLQKLAGGVQAEPTYHCSVLAEKLALGVAEECGIRRRSGRAAHAHANKQSWRKTEMTGEIKEGVSNFLSVNLHGQLGG
jgi:hypothetical protein